MALAQGSGSSTDEFKDFTVDTKGDQKKREFFTPEQKQIIDKNKKKIRAFLRQLGNSKFGKLIVPITASLIAKDQLVRKVNEYKENAKLKSDMKIAEHYQSAVDELLSKKEYNIADKKLEDLSEADIGAVQKSINKRYNDLRNKVKNSGGRESPYYGEYLAYHDYNAYLKKLKKQIYVRQLMAQRDSKTTP